MLNLPQEITINNANVVLKTISELVDSSDVNEITLSLSVIAYCDSAGIAVLLEAKKYAASVQKQLYFSCPNQQLQDLANFLKVSELLFID